jgi:hypothetical protein
MAELVCMGATLQCSFGTVPSTLTVVPAGQPVVTGTNPAATIMDHKPMVNIMPFIMCSAPANPAVVAATAAAMGTPTPAPCVPVTPAPWTPGSPTVLIGNMAALNKTSTLACTWGGAITITAPGQFTVSVP